jgi:hypothetical protein
MKLEEEEKAASYGTRRKDILHMLLINRTALLRGGLIDEYCLLLDDSVFIKQIEYAVYKTCTLYYILYVFTCAI